jgi:hypothetical protein
MTYVIFQSDRERSISFRVIATATMDSPRSQANAKWHQLTCKRTLWQRSKIRAVGMSWEHISLSGDFLWDRAAAFASERRPLNRISPSILVPH